MATLGAAPTQRVSSTRNTGDRLCVMWPLSGGEVGVLSYGRGGGYRTYEHDNIDPRAIVNFIAESDGDVLRGLQAEPGSKSAFAVPVKLAIRVLGWKAADFADA